MLKILQILYEPAPSGQCTHVRSLTKCLVQKGHIVTIVIPERLMSEVDTFSLTGARVVTLPMGKIFWKPAAVIQFMRLIKRGAFEIVHIHSQEAGLVARPLTKLAGAKAIVYTPQTIDIRQARWSKAYSFVELCLSYLTAKIISVNEVDRLRLIKWGIHSRKVACIPNGIDLSIYNKLTGYDDIRQKMGIGTDSPVVIQIGRLSPQKNPFAFIEGAQLVLNEMPNTQFLLIGEGPLKEVLEKRINALKLGERIHILGRFPNAYRLVANANVVTLTSLWEGTPYSLLEAMAWSLPVVSTDVNGCREVVLDSKSGLLSPPGDIQHWAENVARLLREPHLAKKMGERGRRHLEEHFTLNRMVSKIEDLYYELVNKGSFIEA